MIDDTELNDLDRQVYRLLRGIIPWSIVLLVERNLEDEIWRQLYASLMWVETQMEMENL